MLLSGLGGKYLTGFGRNQPLADFPDQHCRNRPEACGSFHSQNQGSQRASKAARRAFAEEFAHQQPKIGRTRYTISRFGIFSGPANAPAAII